MKGKALRKHSLHEKTAASVLPQTGTTASVNHQRPNFNQKHYRHIKYGSFLTIRHFFKKSLIIAAASYLYMTE